MNNELPGINSILADYRLSQSELSRRLGIPLRTIQDWCGGRRQPAEWLLRLIKTALEYEMVKTR